MTTDAALDMEEGYYVLDADVKNPHADRRYKSFDKLTAWKKGTRFRLKKTKYGDFRFTLYKGGIDYNYPQVLGVLRPHLALAPVTVGQIEENYFAESHDILSQMVKMGIVSINQVQEAAHVLYDVDSESEAGFLEALREDQWLNESN